ncbi:MAG: hypothetical protein EOO54_12565 [Haliea sp.]|nr:MAG: hypothetical protein EOO54_12565 [Haliea sp.]
MGRRLGLAFAFIWFFVGGIAHFVFTEAEMRIVPSYIAWPLAAVLVSGALELLGALGLLWRPTRSAAAWGLVALTVAVTPANIHMLQHAAQFPGVPYWALVLRLPLQVALLALLVWIARTPSRGVDRSP